MVQVKEKTIEQLRATINFMEKRIKTFEREKEEYEKIKGDSHNPIQRITFGVENLSDDNSEEPQAIMNEMEKQMTDLRKEKRNWKIR